MALPAERFQPDCSMSDLTFSLFYPVPPNQNLDRFMSQNQFATCCSFVFRPFRFDPPCIMVFVDRQTRGANTVRFSDEAGNGTGR